MAKKKKKCPPFGRSESTHPYRPALSKVLAACCSPGHLKVVVIFQGRGLLTARLSICKFLNFSQTRRVQKLMSNILFHITQCLSFSFQSRLRPWCFIYLFTFLFKAFEYPEAAWSSPSPQPFPSPNSSLGRLVFRRRLTKPIWRHPDDEEEWSTGWGCLCKWGQCDTSGCFAASDRVSPEKKERKKWVCVACCSKSPHLVNRFRWMRFTPPIHTHTHFAHTLQVETNAGKASLQVTGKNMRNHPESHRGAIN